MGDTAPGSEHVISMLRSDHEHIRELLTRLEDVSDKSEQELVLAQLFLLIRIHSACEQKVFYPSLSTMIDEKRIAEFGKDLYCLLSLMLELENSCAASAPTQATFSTLVDRFDQHVKKDEGLFNQVEKWAIDFRTQLSTVADKMDACRDDLQEKFVRTQRSAGRQGFAGPMFVRRPRCA